MEIAKYLNMGHNIEHKIKSSTLYENGVLGYAENAIDKINMSDKGKDIFKNTVRVAVAGAIVLGACDRLPKKDSSAVTQPGNTPGLVVPPPDGAEIPGGGSAIEAPSVTPVSTEIPIVGYGGQLTAEQQAFTETQRAQGMKIGLENYVNYWEEFRVFASGTQLSLIPYPDQSDPTNINKMVYVAEVSGDLNYDGFVITIPIAQYQKYLETGDPQVMLPPQNATTLMENTDPFKMSKQVEEGSIPNLAGIPTGAVNGVMNGEFVYFAPGTTGALEVVGKLDKNFQWGVTPEGQLSLDLKRWEIAPDKYNIGHDKDDKIELREKGTNKLIYWDGRWSSDVIVKMVIATNDCQETKFVPASPTANWTTEEFLKEFEEYIRLMDKQSRALPSYKKFKQEGFGFLRPVPLAKTNNCWGQFIFLPSRELNLFIWFKANGEADLAGLFESELHK